MVEGGGLLNRYAVNSCIEGSNPSPSANPQEGPDLRRPLEEWVNGGSVNEPLFDAKVRAGIRPRGPQARRAR